MRILLPLVLLLSGCAAAPPLRDAAAPAVAVAAQPVPLDYSDPERTVVGRLRYLGGVHLRSPDKRFGGLSSLEWRHRRLHSVTDDGDWTSLRPVERDGRLVGVADVALGDLLGEDGSALDSDTGSGDSEALVHDGTDWLVAFEHQHRMLRYRTLGGRPAGERLDPRAILGPLEDNQGVEALASRAGRLFLCAERLPTEAAANCAILQEGDAPEPVRVPPPPGLDPRTAFPVDARWAADGTLFILFRSWSQNQPYRIGIVARAPDGDLRTIAAFQPPLIVDNVEGLALREERGRTFLYLVSDDNFGRYDDPAKPETWQRTLLMKFELVG